MGKNVKGSQTLEFARLLSLGHSPEYCAKEAGLPVNAWKRLVDDPRVLSACTDYMQAALVYQDAPAALIVLRNAMLDASSPPGVRVDCAKTLLSRAGISEQKAEAKALVREVAPSELTGAALQREIDALQLEVDNRMNSETPTLANLIG